MSIDKSKLVDSFTKFANTYDMNDYKISKKYHHPIRVMKLCEDIAHTLNLNDVDTDVAIVVGLLHDYSRFEQWTKYHTYNDFKSVDHADLAVEKLFDDGHIKEYYENTEKYPMIYDAIKYHNKKYVDKDIDIKNLTMCNIIRDADKLDIFRIIIDEAQPIKNDNLPINEKILKDFYDCKIIDSRDIKGVFDRLLMKLGMIFDLNYKYSFEFLIDNDIVWKLFEFVEDKELLKPYFDFVWKYVQDKAQER